MCVVYINDNNWHFKIQWGFKKKKKKKDPVDQLCMLINNQELVICLDSRFYGILLITVIYKRVNSRML